MLPDPDSQEVESLKDWVRGTGFNKNEAQYLEQSDLASLAVPSDRAVKVVEAFVEKRIAYLGETVGKANSPSLFQ